MPPEEQVIIEEPAPVDKEISIDSELTAEKETKIVDPGEFEGLPKPKPEPPEGHPRFNQVYAKMKDLERRFESNESVLKEKDAVLEEVRKHNKSLMDKLEELSNKAIDKVDSIKQDETQVPEKTAAVLERVIEGIEEQKIAAMEALDYARVAKLDKEIRTLERELIVEKTKPKTEPKPKETAKPKEQPPEQGPHPDVKKFIDETPWWDKDPIMRGAAIEYDRTIMTDPKWGSKQPSERLAEVKRVIEERFNYGQKDEKKKPRASDVEAPTSGLTTTTDGKRAYRLTQQEMLVCKGLGITPEEYVKQKLIMER